jgi:hypothetical protein
MPRIYLATWDLCDMAADLCDDALAQPMLPSE